MVFDAFAFFCFILKNWRCIMKKRLLIYLTIVSLAIATILTGCGSGNASNTTAVESTEATKLAIEPELKSEIESAAKKEAAQEQTEGEEAELTIFIAASLANVMEEIQSMYAEIAPNVTLTFNADSSGTLQTQIEEGAACDIFFSAATKQMTALEEGGYVVDNTVVNLLENQVVLIKAAGAKTTVTGFEDITNASSLTMGGEDTPAGAYAREIFTSLGNIDDVLAMEINEGANVMTVLTAVSEMSNEVGVVYATDAASMPDAVEIIAAAPAGTLEKPAIYPVGQIVNQEASQVRLDATTAFLEYLITDEVLKVFKNYGFSIYAE